MPPEKRRENGVGREEGRRSVSALYHELQTSICQKRPIFRIPYFRTSKCRPLESSAGANALPRRPPSPAATAVRSTQRIFSDKPTLHDSSENVVEECSSVTVTVTLSAGHFSDIR